MNLSRFTNYELLVMDHGILVWFYGIPIVELVQFISCTALQLVLARHNVSLSTLVQWLATTRSVRIGFPLRPLQQPLHENTVQKDGGTDSAGGLGATRNMYVPCRVRAVLISKSTTQQRERKPPHAQPAKMKMK